MLTLFSELLFRFNYIGYGNISVRSGSVANCHLPVGGYGAAVGNRRHHRHPKPDSRWAFLACQSMVVNPCQRRDSASWRGFLRYVATIIIVVQKSTGENLSRRIIVTARPALLADHKVCDCVVFKRSVSTLKHM